MIENSSDKKYIEMDERNNPLMSSKTLRFYCEKQSLPSQPELNETLYLQYKGFQKIVPQTISLYINLKTLHLNNNGIVKIEGLHMLRQLINLYLNNNFIEKIEGLQELYNLKVLNLAHNKFDHIQGLDSLQNLRNLNLAENFFTKPKDIEGLISLTNLTELNLSQNQMQASQEMFQTITELQNLTILYLKATPLSNFFKNYRKRMVSKLKKLKFLDNRPVLPRDHQLAEAWTQGGTQKQTELKDRIIDQKRQEQQKQFEIQTKKGEQKMREQQQKLKIANAIFYEQSQRTQSEQGLNSAYLPKKQTKLQNFLDQEIKQSESKVIHAKENVKTQLQSEDIHKKVGQILGNNKSAEQQQEEETKLKRSIDRKWNKKYEKLLQELLMKYKFDFSEAQPSLNMILSNINKQLLKPTVRFEINELRHIWTDIQKDRRVQEQQKFIAANEANSQKQVIKDNEVKIQQFVQ